MNIYLVRHGKQIECNCNEDVKLSDIGFMQARLVGERFKSYNIDKIYCSTLLRAKQTALTINELLNVDMEICENLQEISFGAMEGHDSKYNQAQFKDFFEEFSLHNEDIPYPNGECGEDVRKRAMKAIEKIVDEGYENVVVVTHGGTIRSLLSGFLGLPQQKRTLIGCPFENCSISTIKYNRDKNIYYVHNINDYSHLE